MRKAPDGAAFRGKERQKAEVDTANDPEMDRLGSLPREVVGLVKWKRPGLREPRAS
jgi:hypothetical protein